MKRWNLLALVGGVLLSATTLGANDLWFATGDDLATAENSIMTTVDALPGGGVGFAVTPAGSVWVASRDEARLRHYDVDGTLLLDLVTPVPLQGIAVAKDGSVWATRPTLHDLWHIAADGTDLGSVPTGLVPYGVAIDRDERVWVANSFGNSVTRHDPTTGANETYPVGFFPSAIVCSADGSVWITEKEDVRRLSADGVELAEVEANGFPLGLTIDRAGRVWVAHQNNHEVMVLAADGTLVTTIATGLKPRGVAAAGDGSVWVLCRFSDQVIRYGANFVELEVISADTPDALGDFTGMTYALSVDPTGDVDGDGSSNESEAALGFDPLDPLSSPATFVRGDADRNGNVEFIDAFQSLDTLFGVAATDCPEALDVNDDGALDLADPVYLIVYLTGLGPAPEAPFPVAGPDPSPDLGYPCD